MSVSELAALGKATIFIPSPFVSEDHQTKNAMSLVDQNAALLCADKDAKQEIGKLALGVLSSDSQKAALELEIKKLGLPKAASTIVNHITSSLG